MTELVQWARRLAAAAVHTPTGTRGIAQVLAEREVEAHLVCRSLDRPSEHQGAEQQQPTGSRPCSTHQASHPAYGTSRPTACKARNRPSILELSSCVQKRRSRNLTSSRRVAFGDAVVDSASYHSEGHTQPECPKKESAHTMPSGHQRPPKSGPHGIRQYQPHTVSVGHPCAPCSIRS